MKTETKEKLLSRSTGIAEYITLGVYVVLCAVIGVFHEPWFDEAQAWSIARSAPYRDILFDIPHYEGHPPLWSLILSVPAKLGAPFELSLKAVNLVICAAAVWMILFRSPFPRIVRIALPFSFYFSYQTAVICRPYSLVLLALCLAANGYKDRNEKPLGYILPLMLLCASHAYGIILAGGLCIVWVCEILSSAIREHKAAELLRDRRCYALALILVFALVTIALIIPAKDVRYLNMDYTLSQRLKNSYLLLVYPIDSLFGIYIDVDSFKQTTSGLITTMIGGALLLAFLFAFTKANKKLATFALPYFMFLGFGVLRYMYWNHLGISTFYIMFTAWIICAEGTPRLPAAFTKIKGKIESPMTLRLGKAAALLICAMPFAWTVSSSVMDILSPYGMREVAQFIKDNDMQGHTIMMCWLYEYKNTSQRTLGGEPADYRTAANRINMSNEMSDASALSPYFEGNIFYNFNTTHPTDLYSRFRITTEEDNERNFALWREYGYPEYMIFKCPIDSVFPELEYKDIDEMYEVIGMFERNCFYKFSAITEYVHIFRLKDEYRKGASS